MVIMLIADILMDWYFDGTSPLNSVGNMGVIWPNVRSGLFFGTTMAIYEILTTKVYKE